MKGTSRPNRVAVNSRLFRLLATLSTLVIVVAVPVVLGGCSGGSTTSSTPSSAAPTTAVGTPATSSPSGSPATTGGAATTSGPASTAQGSTKPYEDKQYKYGFSYPKNWRLTEDVSVEGSAGGKAAKTVGVFDPKGDRKGDTLQNGVALSVYKLNTVVDGSLMPAFKEELAGVLPELESQLTDVVVVEPLRETSINGIPGFETTYTFADGDKTLRSRMLFLISGDLEYQITAQTVDTSWDETQPQLNIILGSFSKLE